MILITGGNGQLGSSLKKFIKSDAIFLNSSELDITNINDIKSSIDRYMPSHIINCAAYTNVEKAESNSETAFLVNQHGVSNLAKSCESNKIPLIHISTDYVFDGKKNTPYTEEDQPNPINTYGKSKLAGEYAMLEALNTGLIIRTSWLYSTSESNFVVKVLHMLKSNKELNIVYDQIGSPTFSDDLAKSISIILDKWNFNGIELFHYSNEGFASWYDFACSIAKLSGFKTPINPVKSSDFPSKVNRPPFTLLSKDKIKSSIGITIDHWEKSLLRCITEKV